MTAPGRGLARSVFHARAVWLVGSAIVLANGCAAAMRENAESRLTSVREELYFGASIPGDGMISDDAWEQFVDEEVAPRFPNGFTILRAEGYWRQEDGTGVEEPTRILIVLRASGDRRADSAISTIAEAFKRRFRQESVLRVTDHVGARF